MNTYRQNWNAPAGLRLFATSGSSYSYGFALPFDFPEDVIVQIRIKIPIENTATLGKVFLVNLDTMIIHYVSIPFYFMNDIDDPLAKILIIRDLIFNPQKFMVCFVIDSGRFYSFANSDPTEAHIIKPMHWNSRYHYNAIDSYKGQVFIPEYYAANGQGWGVEVTTDPNYIPQDGLIVLSGMRNPFIFKRKANHLLFHTVNVNTALIQYKPKAHLLFPAMLGAVNLLPQIYSVVSKSAIARMHYMPQTYSLAVLDTMNRFILYKPKTYTLLASLLGGVIHPIKTYKPIILANKSCIKAIEPSIKPHIIAPKDGPFISSNAGIDFDLLIDNKHTINKQILFHLTKHNKTNKMLYLKVEVNNEIVIDYTSNPIDLYTYDFSLSAGKLDFGINQCKVTIRYANNLEKHFITLLYKENPIDLKAQRTFDIHTDGYQGEFTRTWELKHHTRYLPAYLHKFPNFTGVCPLNIVSTAIRPPNTYMLTTDTTNFPLQWYRGIKKITIDGDGIIVAVSFDKRNNWYSYKNNLWQKLSLNDLQSKGMNQTELSAITEEQWNRIYKATQLDVVYLFNNAVSYYYLKGIIYSGNYQSAIYFATIHNINIEFADLRKSNQAIIF